MAFDYEAARAEGYTDAEIADHLAKRYKFDIGGARTAGYNDQDILGHLAPKAGFQLTKAPEPEQTTPGRLSPKYGGQTAGQQTEYTQGKTTNPFHGAIARAANILGEGVEGVARLAEAGGDYLESKISLSGLTEDQIKNERQLEPLFQFAQSAKNWSKSIGYEPSTKLNELTDNPLNAIPFIAERVISSSPDMIAAVYAMPAYFSARTNEILNDRLANDNKTIDQVTLGDISAAAGSAALEVSLERFATKHLLKGAPITGKTALGRVGKEVGFQSLTEGAEEGIGYLGGTVGTEKGVDPDQLAQNVIEGAIVGGGLGGAVKGTHETAQKYAEYREKKRESLLAEGVDPDIADQAVNQMDKEREALGGALKEVKSGEAVKDNGEIDLDYLEQKYGRQEAPEPVVAPAPPAPPAAPAPVVAAPVAAPVIEQPELPAAELPPIPEEERVMPKEVVLQNRDRSTPASVSQMQGIAAQPDYLRLGTSNVATVGAPIVFGDVKFPEQFLGNETVVTDESGNRYPMQYAVVEAAQVMPSNQADGSVNKDYATFQGLRAIGGNGRMAGLQGAYERGTADTYRADLESDQNHGIAPEAISEFTNPVLVRLMDPDMVDENTADNFNITGTQNLDVVSKAENDARRVNLEALEFTQDGSLTPAAVKKFIAAMPVAEQNELMTKEGQPTQDATSRLERAVFQKAYGNSQLTNLAFADQSNEAANIRKALMEVAPMVMQLEGANEYDFRPELNEAVMKAINAKRSGLSLDEAARQMAIDEHPLVNDIVQMFADNARSFRKIADNLERLTAMSLHESRQPAIDMLGDRPKRTVEQVRKEALAKAEDLLAKEEAAPKAVAKEEKPAAAKENAEALKDFAEDLMSKGKRTESVKTITKDGKKIDQWTVKIVANLNKEQAAVWKENFGQALKATLVSEPKNHIDITISASKINAPINSGRKYTMDWVAEVEHVPADVRAEKVKEISSRMQELNRSTERFPGANYDATLDQLTAKYRMASVAQMDADIKRLDNSLRKDVERKAKKTQELWKDSEFAGRIDKMLTDLRSAGANEFAAMLNTAFNNEVSAGKLDEKGVAFREESARKELARYGERKPIKYEPMTVDKLVRSFAELKALPAEIQQAAVDQWNSIAPKLYDMGFRFRETQSSRDKAAQDLDKQLNGIQADLRSLAGRRYENAMLDSREFKTDEARIKAFENSESKLAEAEVRATEALGFETAQHPGVDTSRPMDVYGDYVEAMPGEKIVKAEDLHKILDETPKKETVAKGEEAPLGVSDEDMAEIADDFAGAIATQEDEDGVVTHVFDPPAKDEIVRLDEKARVYVAEHGWMTPAEAKKEIKKWKDNVNKQDKMNVNGNKIVLSLFDLSGEWSKPWEEAGYTVFRFDIQDQDTYFDSETEEEKVVGDINNFSVQFFNDLFGDFDGNDVYAVLAACPCTDFASSGARHFATKDANGQTVASVELVHQTLRTIEYFKPQVWAIENPVGRIEKLTGLTPWRLSFNPNQFGDPYTKRTLLWGRFNADLPIAPVEATEGSKMHRLYGGKSQATKNARSVTPEGFAYAFFQANNAVDHPVMAIANKYDRLDRELFQQAVDVGMTFDEMNSVVEDPYYMDMDDEQAAQNLVDAIAEKTGETSSNWSIALGQSISNAANDDVRRQQIKELQSVKQQMSAIERRLAKGELKPTDEAIYKTLYDSSTRLRDDVKYSYQPNKSPAKFLADAAKALANGDITQEVFDVVDFMYKKQPNLLEGLRLSIRKQKGEQESMAKGQFNGLARIVRLFKETDGVKDPSTLRHELAHSLEQMMTAEARERVVNVWRDKLLRAQKAEKTKEGKTYFENVAKYLAAPSQKTWNDAAMSMPNISYYQYISPSEYWAANAEPLMKAQMGGAWARFVSAIKGMYEGLKNVFGFSNNYDIHKVYKQVIDGERMSTYQLDDFFIRTGFKPLFSASKHKNIYGGKPADSTWIARVPGEYTYNGFLKKYMEYIANKTPVGKFIDYLQYNLLDKFVDLSRIQKAIGKIGEAFDAYMRETLYHGAVASKMDNFFAYEFMPLIKKMAKYGIDKTQLNKYLHALHAPEYNAHINEINPNAAPGMPLHNTGSGMSNAEAAAYMASLSKEEKTKYEELAKMVKKIVRGTQDQLVEGQIEKQDTIDEWRRMFPDYAPLYRTELDYANTSAEIGRGFSTQSGFGRSATGSLKDVDDILSNIMAQRERAVVRSAKGVIGRTLYAQALQNPNSKFWLPVNPNAGSIGKVNRAYAEYQSKLEDAENYQKQIENNQIEGIPESEYKDLIDKERRARASATRALSAYKKVMFESKSAEAKLKQELRELGLSEQDILNYISEPEVPYIDPTTGKVKYKPNTMARNSDSVLAIPVNGETRYIFFNPNDASAKRLAKSLKNMDVEKMGKLMKMFGAYTQFISKASTQWNLVFGLINFLRDVQGAMLNLTSTAIAGKQKDVLKNIGPALKGIYAEQRLTRKSEKGGSYWNKLWKEFQAEGGQTGFRDQFAKTEEQASRLDREMKKLQSGKVVSTVRQAFEWVSDVNETAENAVRLSAYEAAKKKFISEGMSEPLAKAKAAELAKNLTVNFNRKGAATKTANALYAFFNASVQGTARIAQTLAGPKGLMIMSGLVAVGIADAIAMSMAGFGDDKPPEFVKQRNLIIPVGGGNYVQFPMPLGFNFFVNLGRMITEYGLYPDKSGKDTVKNVMTAALDSTNPLGQGNLAYIVAPTIADPMVGLVSNRDAFDRPIYKADQATNPLPGYMRKKESASDIATGISWFINRATGGTDYMQGIWSPTPDQLEYIGGQLTGGVGREALRLGKYAGSVASGTPSEERAYHQVPVVGRFYGETTGQSNVSDSFYKNVTQLAEYEHEIKGRRKDKGDVQGFMEEHPEAKLWSSANRIENQISDLKKRRREAKERGNEDQVKKLNEQITRVMDQFNKRYKDATKR